MKKYVFSLLAYSIFAVSLNAQSVQNSSFKTKSEMNPQNAQLRQEILKQKIEENTKNDQYIFIIATEDFNGKITAIEVSGEIDVNNIEIKTAADKQRFIASKNANESLNQVKTISEIFEKASNGFKFENHNIVQFDKELRHYILFSVK